MRNDTQVSYIWPMETVGAIERLRTSVLIDRIAVAQYGQAIKDSARDRLAKSLSRLAEPWAVVLDPSDCKFREVDEDDDFRVRVECAWRPATNEIEMHGGPADGEVLAVQRVGDEIVVAVQAPVRWSQEVEPTITVAADRVAYRLAGWSEQNRRWVYRP